MQPLVKHRHAGAPWSKCDSRTISEFLDRHCNRLRDKPVLIYEDGLKVTRGELIDRAESFAAWLSERIRPGERVAIMVGNRTEYFIALFAVIANRGVLVSLNPDAKEHDAGYVIRDADPVLAIVEKSCEAVVEAVRPTCPTLREVIVLDGAEPDGLSKYKGSSPCLPFKEAACERDDITVVYYTSGTTGAPKGCKLHHGWWLRIVDVDLRMNPDGRERGFCSVPFYYADPSLYLMYALQVGGSLVVMRKFSVSRYWDVVVDNEVTKIHAIASIPVLLLKGVPKAKEKAHRVHHATCVAVPTNMHKDLVERFGFPWIDNYGSTEAGQMCRVPIEYAGEMVGSGSLGVPDPEVDLRIVDENDREVAPGEIGEILVRGPEMFRGYLNRPEATAEALRDGWYHTGDLGRYDERGYVYFQGRRKDVIRRSGENLSASEVEAVLRLHPKILDAAVIPTPDEIRGEEVKAYVQLVEGVTPDMLPPQEIADFCKANLAAFKVPRYIEYRLTDFPRTPSMRIQKEALKKEKPDLTVGAWDREAALAMAR